MSAIGALQHMPLSSAYLCEDCHSVGNCAMACPACASGALLCLAGIFNRESADTHLEDDGFGLKLDLEDGLDIEISYLNF